VNIGVIVDSKQCGSDFNALAKKRTNFSLLLRTKIWSWILQMQTKN